MNLWVSFVIAFLFVGCGDQRIIETKPEISKAKLEKVSLKSIDGFSKDNLDLALSVFKKDCQARRINKNLKKVCLKANSYTNGYTFFIENFDGYKLLNNKKSDIGLITGYYEPILNGSLTKTSKYKYPIYSLPKDLVIVSLGSIYPELKKYRLRGKLKGNRVVPFDTRAQFDSKEHKNIKVICYVDNNVDRFFLEIQGSGRVKLQNGSIINVGYAGQNGRPYYPIGRKLIKDGEIKKEDMSLQAIKKWCDDNPSKVDDLLNLNQSKVFFIKSTKTATGSLGVPLVAKRNLAVDRKYIPLGFPVFINTTNPVTNNDINRLMVAADTGGAIKGDIRADFFWGNGEEAKENAGKMAQKGKLTILLPKNTQSKQKWSNDTRKYLKVKENY
ncbi:MAG: murein transglycosylase A [Campylobacteraceae bacterium]|jgi:membrane-bound lytic murein transglycosylase A|nr:murein transglycosylase A [Campylobacteraceae bacterium]MBT3882918.1 murein transglycosylase A [Campylobacteraceae bacterium]MBT4030901.1 murein transglycosylase A [Campylobacteraceae bacterium]MBT4179226.1 murein transglycosylase A [Campylobacteraceae bacterium]MBT4572844.1 murein transglycosylase A [Campylobacteraceae bacterium]